MGKTEKPCIFALLVVEWKSNDSRCTYFIKDRVDFMSSIKRICEPQSAPANGGSFCEKLNYFLTTPLYISAIMLLTALSNLLSLELVTYTVFALLFAYICVLGTDLLGLIPVVICCYIAPSVSNNPGRSDQSVFAGTSGIYLGCLAAVIAFSFIYRLIKDRKTFFTKKYRMLWGLIILALTYLTGGIGSNGYGENAGKSIFFAILQGFSLIFPYFFIAGGVNWKTARKDYLAWTGFGVGCLLVLEVLWIYCSCPVIVNGVINRTTIYTGWGMYNNMGSLLAMMIPFPFYLATKYRRGWIGTVVGSVFYLGVLLSCSRASILCGGAVYFACVILMLYYANNRKANTVALITFGGIVCGIALIFSEPLLNLFSSLLDKGLDPSSRDMIYANGLKLFSKYPIFGGSFFSSEYTAWGWSTTEGFTSFFPPRWHNTFVQLLASCGIVGLAAYLLHRAQTVILLFKKQNKERNFIACSVLVLLACSLFDCHFFNIGPVLFYSMALAFAENCKSK